MVTKTAGELLHGAMVKAQVYNVDFLDFHTVTNELNNAYRQLYTEIAESDSDFFIKTAEYSEAVFALPRDCFMIKTVNFRNNDGTLTSIEKQPPKEFIPGCYYIQNGVFHYNGTPQRPIVIRYVPDAQTITCPREMEAIDVADIAEAGRMTDKGFFYKNGNDECFYWSFDELTSEEIDEDDYKTANSRYLGKKVEVDYDDQTVYIGDEDYSEYFYEEEFGDFVRIVFDSPYCMISYEDGHIMVMNGLQKTLWNPNAATGHETLGEIIALRTNDKTLWGCVYVDEDGELWRASFVPDTVMNYPSNALFNYLEVILARLFLSMNGIENEYIQKDLYESVRQQFYKELKAYRSSVTQVNNVCTRRNRLR